CHPLYYQLLVILHPTRCNPQDRWRWVSGAILGWRSIMVGAIINGDLNGGLSPISRSYHWPS
ncbi:hypothetical protein WG66_000825, partial [Moniliophthora roreri]